MTRKDAEATADPEPGTAADTSALAADVEKLGRQRPAAFSTIWAELGFITALLGSMLMAVSSHSSLQARDHGSLLTPCVS